MIKQFFSNNKTNNKTIIKDVENRLKGINDK